MSNEHEIDEWAPLKEASKPAKEIFKKVVELELHNLHRENPPLEEEVINIVKVVIK